jgi:glucosyl-3-phosphoglycerate synthase
MAPDQESAAPAAGSSPSPGPRVTVVIPAVDEAEHITATVIAARALGDRLDHVLVVDGGSGDDTADLAAAAGAEVERAAQVRPDLGTVLGKGD